MEAIPVADAARRLSISPVAAYEAMRSGRLERVPRLDPARVTDASVQRMSSERRTEAQRRHSDLCALARQADSLLHAPAGSTYLPPPGPEALRALSADTFAIFGRDVLEAAASRDRLRKDGSCPTCWARVSARVHQTHPPQDSAAYKILLGQPCGADRQRWAAEAETRRREMARLRSAEERNRRASEQARVRAELQTARAEAGTAASRLQNATRAMSAIDPSIARQAAAQARRRATFNAQPPRKKTEWPSWCDCGADHQCAGHAENDRTAAKLAIVERNLRGYR